MVDRPTQDVDLFADALDPAASDPAGEPLTSALGGAGHDVYRSRRELGSARTTSAAR